jgi:tRNA1(Val) A37 N6-methylase TrmN6
MTKLYENERLDELHIKGYKIIQNKEGFCFGQDAVLLTGFTHVLEGEKVLDLGTGTGIIPILLEAKTQAKHITGLEIQEASVLMARRSIELNQLAEKIDIVLGDIVNATNLFPLASFDVITSNPPYMDKGTGLVNDRSPKAIARHEIYCNLKDVIYACSKLVKVGGRFYMVHRPNRLGEIIALLKEMKMEPKRIRFVHPYQDKEANLVLIESVRYGKPFLKIEKPLIVYQEKNKYTDEIYEIYGYEKNEK